MQFHRLVYKPRYKQYVQLEQLPFIINSIYTNSFQNLINRGYIDALKTFILVLAYIHYPSKIPSASYLRLFKKKKPKTPYIFYMTVTESKGDPYFSIICCIKSYFHSDFSLQQS